MGERDDELGAVWSHKLLSSLSETAEPASWPPHFTPQCNIEKSRQTCVLGQG